MALWRALSCPYGHSKRTGGFQPALFRPHEDACHAAGCSAAGHARISHWCGGTAGGSEPPWPELLTSLALIHLLLDPFVHGVILCLARVLHQQSELGQACGDDAVPLHNIVIFISQQVTTCMSQEARRAITQHSISICAFGVALQRQAPC